MSWSYILLISAVAQGWLSIQCLCHCAISSCSQRTRFLGGWRRLPQKLWLQALGHLVTWEERCTFTIPFSDSHARDNMMSKHNVSKFYIKLRKPNKGTQGRRASCFVCSCYCLSHSSLKFIQQEKVEALFLCSGAQGSLLFFWMDHCPIGITDWHSNTDLGQAGTIYRVILPNCFSLRRPSKLGLSCPRRIRCPAPKQWCYKNLK